MSMQPSAHSFIKAEHVSRYVHNTIINLFIHEMAEFCRKGLAKDLTKSRNALRRYSDDPDWLEKSESLERKESTLKAWLQPVTRRVSLEWE